VLLAASARFGPATRGGRTCPKVDRRLSAAAAIAPGRDLKVAER